VARKEWVLMDWNRPQFLASFEQVEVNNVKEVLNKILKIFLG
jgi:hypothetical protein